MCVCVCVCDLLRLRGCYTWVWGDSTWDLHQHLRSTPNSSTSLLELLDAAQLPGKPRKEIVQKLPPPQAPGHILRGVGVEEKEGPVPTGSEWGSNATLSQHPTPPTPAPVWLCLSVPPAAPAFYVLWPFPHPTLPPGPTYPKGSFHFLEVKMSSPNLHSLKEQGPLVSGQGLKSSCLAWWSDRNMQ